MVRTFALAPVRAALALGTALVLLAGLTHSSAAQDGPRPKARTLLRAGIDSNKRGDYEMAAKYYDMAVAGRAELNSVEQSDLAKLIEQNNVALKGRQDGAVAIERSFQFMERGNNAEAAKLLRAAETNPYLSGADRSSLVALQDRLRRTTSGATIEAKSMSEPVSKDVKSMLAAGRAALGRGEVDMAEAFCVQAEKLEHWYDVWAPWSDSPAKLRRDVQAARAKLMPDVADKKEHRGILSGIFGGKKDEKPAPREIAKGPETPKEPHLTGYTPKGAEIPAGGIPAGAAATTRAVQLIHEGYAALDRGDIATAQKKALEAKALRPDLSWAERNPDRLLADIEARTTGKTMVPSPAAAKLTAADARELVKRARAALAANKVDEAERMVIDAAAVNGVRWGLFEDTPEKVRRDIQNLRARHDKEESAKLLTEARALFNAGNLHDAKIKAWQAQRLHGPYSIWDMGDRPQKLLDEINRAETKGGKAPAVEPKLDGASLPRLGEKTVARGDVAPAVFPSVAPKAGVSAAMAGAERQKATLLLAEARDLQKKGLLVEARAKALDAKKVGVLFGPEEDSPEKALWSLSVLCDNTVQGYLKRATDTVSDHPSDPDRFKKAQTDIQTARQLATAFGQDVARIDQKMLWLQQTALAAGAPPIGAPPTTTPGLPTDALAKAGHEKLDKARLELRAGNTSVARRLAEEAYNPTYHVQEEALMVLRSIDAEEGNQVKLQAERSARAALDAFSRKDFRMAASILNGIDTRLLSPEAFGRVREMMAAPQMVMADMSSGGGELRPVDHRELPATPLKVGATGAIDRSDSVSDGLRAMEKIQFQQLRERTLSALTKAHDLMTRGMDENAIDLLTEQAEQIGKAGLEPELTTPLKRQVDFRLQQYRTLQAQKKLEGHRDDIARNPEAVRTRKIAATQQEVKEKIDLCNALMKEGKFKDAKLAALKAQELDPDNLAAQYAYSTADMKMRLDDIERRKKRNEEDVYRETTNDFGPFVHSDQPVVLDPARLAIAKKRGYGNGIPTYGKTPFQRAVEDRMKQPVNLKLVNTPLEQSLQVLSAEAGRLNMVPDLKALSEEGISLDMPVSVSLEGVSLKSALNIILNQAHLTHVVREDYISITTERAAKGKMKQVVYPVADLVVPVENHPTSPVNNMQDALMRHIATQSGVNVAPPSPYIPPTGINAGATPVSSYSSGLGSAFASAPTPGGGAPGFNVVKNNGNTIEDMLINLITNTVAQDTWGSMGGPGTIQYYPLGMALVINQSAEVQEEVLNLLQALRRLQDLEVAIELKLVNVSEAFFERLGVDFDVNIRTNTARREPDLLTSNFTPFGFVNRNFDRLGLVSGLTPAGTLTPDLNIPLKSSSFDFSVPPFGGFPGTLGADGGLSLGLAFLSDIQVFMFMEAAAGDRRTQVMQAPKITVFNGQTASINVQDQQFFLLGVQLQQAGAQIFFQPQNQPVPLGVNLQVTPVVSADRRFVRLNMTPQMTNLASATVPLIPVQIPVPNLLEGPGAGNTAVGQPVIFQMFFQQPTFSTIFVNTTVNVPDGGTVLLGGLKTMSEARNEFGPPILSQIPYLNRLFKNVGYGREVSSLMIMVTPRIIINEEEEAIFLGQLEPIPREF